MLRIAPRNDLQKAFVWFVLLLATGVLLSTVSVRAAEPINSLPDFQYPSSGRSNFVYAIDKVPLAYGTNEFVQGEGFSIDHQVVVDVQSRTLIEAVTIYGDTTYIRRNAEQRWEKIKGNLSFPVAGGFPELPMENATYYRLGDVEVNGVATTHYQVQIDPAKLPQGTRAANVNFFIGKNDNYIYKFQITEWVTDPQGGEALRESVSVISDHNKPVVVGPPPAHLVN